MYGPFQKNKTFYLSYIFTNIFSISWSGCTSTRVFNNYGFGKHWQLFMWNNNSTYVKCVENNQLKKEKKKFQYFLVMNQYDT